MENRNEKVILVGVALESMRSLNESLDELNELADTAGAVCVGRVTQARPAYSAATYVGKGKVEEHAF